MAAAEATHVASAEAADMTATHMHSAATTVEATTTTVEAASAMAATPAVTAAVSKCPRNHPRGAKQKRRDKFGLPFHHLRPHREPDAPFAGASSQLNQFIRQQINSKGSAGGGNDNFVISGLAAPLRAMSVAKRRQHELLRQ
jgi:hypothetical protein